MTVVDDSGNPLASFTTRFSEGQFTPPETNYDVPDTQFKIQCSYLQEVVDNADDYINNPAMLNWDLLNGNIKPVE